MASNILIKRSTGSTAPGSITFGELAITTGANGTQSNAGDRLFCWRQQWCCTNCRW